MGEPGQFGRILGDALYDVAKQAASDSLASRSARKKVKGAAAPSASPNGDVGSSAVKRIAMDSQFTPAVKQKKKHKKAKKQKPALSKREKRAVRSVINSKEYELVSHRRGDFFLVLKSNFNKVNYTFSPGRVMSDMIDNCTWTVRDPSVSTGSTKAQGISKVLSVGQKFKRQESINFKLYNNTNMEAHLKVYVFKCLDYTNDTVLTELDRMRSAQYPGTTVTREDDFSQHLSVPGQRFLNWKMQSMRAIDMKGGENSQFFIELPKQLFNVNRWIQEGSTNYAPGSSVVIIRSVGRTTHTQAITTAADQISTPGVSADMCINATQIDVHKTETIRYWVEDAGDAIDKYSLAGSNVTTPGVGAQPVLGDAEAPFVGTDKIV